MAIYQPTIALNAENDSYLNPDGGIAIIYGVDSVAQTVSNAIQLFLGEYQYNTTKGIPWTTILGQDFDKLLLDLYIETAVLAVPYVTNIESIKYTNNNNNNQRTLTVNLIYLNSNNASEEINVTV